MLREKTCHTWVPTGNVRAWRGERVLQLTCFCADRRKIQPDTVMYNTLISSCATSALPCQCSMLPMTMRGVCCPLRSNHVYTILFHYLQQSVSSYNFFKGRALLTIIITSSSSSSSSSSIVTGSRISPKYILLLFLRELWGLMVEGGYCDEVMK